MYILMVFAAGAIGGLIYQLGLNIDNKRNK